MTASLKSGKGVVSATSKVIKETNALYLFEDSPLSSPQAQTKSESRPWYKWGDSDNLPQEIFDRIAKNDVMFNAIETSAALLVGLGVNCYTESIVGDKRIQTPVINKDIEEFLEQTQYNSFLYRKAWNTEFCANAFSMLKFDKTGKVSEIKDYDPQDVRAEFYSPSGIIQSYYTCGDFSTNPVYSKDDKDNKNSVFPVRSSKQIKYDAGNSGNFMHHSRYHMAGQKYYSFPRWWFGLDAWLQLSNLIPRFQLANIKNGISPKYLVRIPDFVFDECTDDEAKQKKRQEIVNSIEKKLGGADNAGKTLSVLKQMIGDKEISIDVEPIKFENLDKLFLDTFDISTRAISRAVGIDPKLAGMDSGGKLGSGSDTVQTYNFHLAKNAYKEQVLLEELYMIKRINKWPADIKFSLGKMIFTTMDQNPSGFKNVA